MRVRCLTKCWLVTALGEEGNSITAAQEQLISEIISGIKEEYLENDAEVTIGEEDAEDEVAFIEAGYYMALRGNNFAGDGSTITSLTGTVTAIAVAMAISDSEEGPITAGDSISLLTCRARVTASIGLKYTAF